ncbi:MAG: Transposase, partial [Microvirga sp.]|nr:Transposase [Microvirga sp.]
MWTQAHRARHEPRLKELVSVGAVEQIEGRLEARPMRGGPRPMIRDEIEAALKHLVKDTNHLTLAEYRDRLADKTGVRVHPWTVGRALRRLGLTRKRRPCGRSSRTRPRSRRSAASGLKRSQASPWNASSSSMRALPAPTSSARMPGAAYGERAPGTAPCGHWERVTILGALGPEGIVAAMSIPPGSPG